MARPVSGKMTGTLTSDTLSALLFVLHAVWLLELGVCFYFLFICFKLEPYLERILVSCSTFSPLYGQGCAIPFRLLLLM